MLERKQFSLISVSDTALTQLIACSIEQELGVCSDAEGITPLALFRVVYALALKY